MRKRWKRAVSFLVSASMVVCMTPTAAFAKTTEDSAGDDTSVVEMVPDEASTADTDDAANVASTEATEPASTAAAEEMDEAATETATEAVTEAEEPASTADTEAATEAADDVPKAKTDDAAAADDTAKTDDAAKSDGKNATDGKDDAATEPATEATTDSGSKKKKPEPTNLGDPSYAITPMTMDAPLDLTLEKDEMWVGSFTAPSDGSYVFYQSANYVDFALYSDAKLSDKLESIGIYCVYQLAKGQTVYMALRALDQVEFETCVYSRGCSYIDRQQFKEVYIYTGEPVKLEATVRDEFGELTEGLDFEFLFYDDTQDPISGPPTEAGYYYVRARALSYGEDSEQTYLYWFSIVDQNNLSAGSFKLEKQYYDITSGPVEVQGVVHDSQGNVLAKGVDYVLVFYDDEDAPPPTEPGAYSVYAKGIGDTYFGTIYADGNIYICNPYDIGDSNWFRYAYNGAYEFPYQEEAVTLPELSIYHRDEVTEQ